MVSIKTFASVLTWLGVIPFVGCAAGVWLDPTFLPWGALVLVYGIIILAFLAGIHWGIVVMRTGSAGQAISGEWRLLLWSNLVALLAVLIFFLPDRLLSLILLTLCFLAQWVADAAVKRMGWMPEWYYVLRMRISLAVLASLGAIIVHAWQTGV